MRPARGFVQIIIVAIIALVIGAVVVFGYLKFLEKSPIVSQKNQTQSSPSASVDETANWKTYTNSTIGYSIKYPSDWVIRNPETDPNHICNPENIFLAPNEKLLGICSSGFGGLIDITLTPHGFNLQKEIQAYQGHKLSQQTSTLGGQKSVKLFGVSQLKDEQVDFTGTKMIVYLVERGDQTLIIGYSQARTWIDYSADFEKILSTFKFTDDTASWKTFQSLNLPLSIKYPNTYFVTENTTPARGSFPEIHTIKLVKNDKTTLNLLDNTYDGGLGNPTEAFQFQNDSNTAKIEGSVTKINGNLGPGLGNVTLLGKSSPALRFGFDFDNSLTSAQKETDWAEMQEILKTILINAD